MDRSSSTGALTPSSYGGIVSSNPSEVAPAVVAAQRAIRQGEMQSPMVHLLQQIVVRRLQELQSILEIYGVLVAFEQFLEDIDPKFKVRREKERQEAMRKAAKKDKAAG